MNPNLYLTKASDKIAFTDANEKLFKLILEMRKIYMLYMNKGY